MHDARRNYRFTTDRLIVNEWNSFTPAEWPQQNIAAAVQEVLTEQVTKTLPPPWQGSYSEKRAKQWIEEREDEGIILLAISKAEKKTVGLIVLYEPENDGYIRLGYMLAESAWGKGVATELIRGLVEWSRYNQVHSIIGGVEPQNIASARVLEKCGFIAEKALGEADQLMYKIEFN